MHKNKISPPKNDNLSIHWERVAEFFETLGEEGPEEELWKMLKLALIAGNDYADAKDRGDMIFLYEYTRFLYKDVWALLQAQQKQSGQQ